jgi:hypothetical protein
MRDDSANLEREVEPRPVTYPKLTLLLRLQFGIAFLTVVIASLVALKVIPLIEQKRQLEDQNHRLEKEIRDKEILPEISGDRLLAMASLVSVISPEEKKAETFRALEDQSVKAINELARIHSPTERKLHRAAIVIRFYDKEKDKLRVQAAFHEMHNYGFEQAERCETREVNVPTNAITVLKGDVSAEDIKIIAYCLIRFGNVIKYIGPSSSSNYLRRLSGNRIHLEGEDQVLNDPPLPVERIQLLTIEDMRKGTKIVDIKPVVKGANAQPHPPCKLLRISDLPATLQ